MVMLIITSEAEYKQLLTSSPLPKSVFFFWATWHEPSNVGGQMHGVFTALSNKYPDIQFATVEAEAVADVSEALEVSVVPTFVSMVGHTVTGKVEGADPAEVNKLVKALQQQDPATIAQQQELQQKAAEEKLNQRLQQLTTAAPVMLFMKGTPDAPRCGFSRQIVQLLQEHEVPFASFDILTDEDVRAGLKKYSDWPTYPQLYVRGEFQGGLDIIKEMAAAAAEGDSLKQQLGVADLKLPPPPAPLEERLKQLTTQAPVVLFMKGSPDAPRCGFSRTMVQLLSEEKIDFSHFDILTDEDVRAGLKKYSDWPTYPQLYVRGEFQGGLDIIKEMREAGNLRDQFGL